jgi:hypothetical protein
MMLFSQNGRPVRSPPAYVPQPILHVSYYDVLTFVCFAPQNLYNTLSLHLRVKQCGQINRNDNQHFSCFAYSLLYDQRSHTENVSQ